MKGHGVTTSAGGAALGTPCPALAAFSGWREEAGAVLSHPHRPDSPSAVPAPTPILPPTPLGGAWGHRSGAGTTVSHGPGVRLPPLPPPGFLPGT